MFHLIQNHKKWTNPECFTWSKITWNELILIQNHMKYIKLCFPGEMGWPGGQEGGGEKKKSIRFLYRRIVETSLGGGGPGHSSRNCTSLWRQLNSYATVVSLSLSQSLTLSKFDVLSNKKCFTCECCIYGHHHNIFACFFLSSPFDCQFACRTSASPIQKRQLQ